MKDKLLGYFTNRNIILTVAIFFMAYIAINTMGIIGRNYRLQKQVDALEEEIEVLKLANQELEFKIAYYNTDAFVDKEARDKLGLQAPGEKVLIFPDKVPSSTAQPKAAAAKTTGQQAISNFEQWMYFLFKRQPNQAPQ